MTVLLGAGASASLLSANVLANAFRYHAAQPSVVTHDKLFSSSQLLVLREICDVVLPRTDTPSAGELDVHGFIDYQLVTCFGKWQQRAALHIVDRINHQSTRHYGKQFVDAELAQQTDLLVALEQQALDFTEKEQQQFAQLKSLMIFGFFTTEVGATQALNYQAVPGGFIGSVSYKALGKSWGSLDYY